MFVSARQERRTIANSAGQWNINAISQRSLLRQRCQRREKKKAVALPRLLEVFSLFFLLNDVWHHNGGAGPHSLPWSPPIREQERSDWSFYSLFFLPFFFVLSPNPWEALWKMTTISFPPAALCRRTHSRHYRIDAATMITFCPPIPRSQLLHYAYLLDLFAHYEWKEIIRKGVGGE